MFGLTAVNNESL